MLTPKKRFKVLERDNFRCQYCWKNGKDVSLEIDHIIPKSKWWTDDYNNLITCCRECNSWKWNDIVWVSNWIAKIKIADHENAMVKKFFTERNDYWFWTIDKNNLTFLSWFIKNYYWKYLTRYLKEVKWLNDSEFLEFNESWDFCEKVLIDFDYFIRDNDMLDIFDRIDNKSLRTTTDNNLILNWLISEYIVSNDFPMSFNFKYSLFPKQIEQWQQQKIND